MDDRARTESLTDAAIDRAIDEALDVRPSPEFLARVRMRVMDEPAPAFRLKPEATSWLVRSFRLQGRGFRLRGRSFRLQPEVTMTGVIGVALGLAALVLWRPAAETPGIPARVIELTAAEVPGVTPDRVSAAMPVASPLRSSRRQDLMPRSSARLPEVKVSASDVLGLRRLVEQVEQGHFAKVTLPPPETSIDMFGDIEIDPVVIAPLEPIALLEGVRP